MMVSSDFIYAYTWFYDFVNFRKASEKWNNTYYGHLKNLSRFCTEKYPNNHFLTQNIVDEWCIQRSSENTYSWKLRLSFMTVLLNYGNSRNFINIKLPEIPMDSKTNYIPHAFTEEELYNLFHACDIYEIKINRIDCILKKLISPVLFRLLYSSGMRPIEVVNLQRDDINMENGIVNIRKSKGYQQRYIVLHDSMLELMKQYEDEIIKIFPSRTYFFPRNKNEKFTREWVTRNFSEFWYKYNSAYARAYDLRHNYAIENIMSWTNTGIEFNSKILALSKSMGHSSVKKTMYYFSIVPALYDKLEGLTGQSFNELIPEVLDDEDE